MSSGDDDWAPSEKSAIQSHAKHHKGKRNRRVTSVHSSSCHSHREREKHIDVFQSDS